MASKKSKATDISKKVKDNVYRRDHGKCIICGKPGLPNSHYVRRSRGGLGIEENVATMCIVCHDIYDHGYGTDQQLVKELFEGYMRRQYPGWDEMNLVYDKWADFPI